MNRQLLERMVGAGVLLVALVLVVPTILDGDGSDTGQVEPVDDAPAQRTHTIRLDREPERPPVATAVVPEPTVESSRDADGSSVADTAATPPPQPAASRTLDQGVPAEPPAARPVAPPEPVPPASVPVASGWAVQLGSFADRANAQRLAREVEAKGFAAYLMPMERAGSTLYRVRVGPEATRGKAERLAGTLAAAGYRGQVTPQQPDS